MEYVGKIGEALDSRAAQVLLQDSVHSLDNWRLRAVRRLLARLKIVAENCAPHSIERQVEKETFHIHYLQGSASSGARCVRTRFLGHGSLYHAQHDRPPHSGLDRRGSEQPEPWMKE